MEKILKSNGFSFIRQNGSHKIWSKGNEIISVPSVTLKCVVANRIVKENHLVLN
jgi:predicted RNA binding protein YcfA (HicA-like mRNA interferase family)